ncbi:MAG: PilN domain-containing protein [Pseudomonadota bacterium]
MTASILNKLIPWNPFPYIRSYFQTEIREEILKGINIRLLYFKGELINLESRESVANVALEAQAIAQACKQLLQNEPKKKKQAISIALFLPLTEFIYTQYNLPTVDSLNVKSALNYQREDLLPASDSDLQLTLSHLKNKDNFALWCSTQTIQKFNLAFQQLDLTLSAILPRLALLSNKGQNVKNQGSVSGGQFFRESADNYTAQFSFYNHSLVQLGHITDEDIKVDAFKQEWDAKFAVIDGSREILKNKADWLEMIYARRMSDNYQQSQYAYFPKQIENRVKSRGRLRNSRVIGLLAFVLMFALAVPFVINKVRYLKYAAKYQAFVDGAKGVIEMRAKVLKHEEQWALYHNYPRVNVLDIISRLNKIIPVNSWISSFQIKNGYVEIDGFSPNPAAILEVISAQNDFNKVAFNKNIRATRGQDKERFGITFHIKGLDVEEYEKEYFNKDN